MTITMLSRTLQAPYGARGISKLGLRTIQSARNYATVQPNIARQMPNASRTRPTEQARGERATFTIRGGPMFTGTSFGAKVNTSGEAVFTTSLVGYPESLSDPSYRGQILVFTQPLIGNYGVPSSVARDEFGLLRHFESPNLQACGVVVGNACEKYSHWTAVESLGEWCAREGVPAITGVDTRAIVIYLREQGSSLARITIGEEYDADEDEGFVDPEHINLVRQVSTKAPFHVPSTGDLHVALLDCGVKENILRCLAARGASVTVFPFDYPIHKIAHHFDGMYISNGPGDPTHLQSTIHHVARLMETSAVPIMGICMGHQVLAMAAGAKTIKMRYGNRAHNIPTLDVTTGRCHITSQNHGYAVDAKTLPSEWKEYFVNLNDSSNEGIYHISRPLFSTQFHPESKGGPMDCAYLFDKFLDTVRVYRNQSTATAGLGLGQPSGTTGAGAASVADRRPNPLLVDLLAKERVGVKPNHGGRPPRSAPIEEEGSPLAAAAAA